MENTSIILSDLDGTLFRDDKSISDFTKETIRQAQAKGHQNQSNQIQASQEESSPQNLEKAVFEHIKENDQKQWKNSETKDSSNLAEDF